MIILWIHYQHICQYQMDTSPISFEYLSANTVYEYWIPIRNEYIASTFMNTSLNTYLNTYSNTYQWIQLTNTSLNTIRRTPHKRRIHSFLGRIRPLVLICIDVAYSKSEYKLNTFWIRCKGLPPKQHLITPKTALLRGGSHTSINLSAPCTLQQSTNTCTGAV